ncbi:hypothetical protein L2E82_33186 [Cichorium intybus]|uniref:Uncharacterized protein n=1 Tax=Cichorium intybus TaxID=13427 RepID=A0ACB9BJG7_CICIN|nr:hypothetical protein L2E82_33186 [Cichorium intybus]
MFGFAPLCSLVLILKLNENDKAMRGGGSSQPRHCLILNYLSSPQPVIRISLNPNLKPSNPDSSLSFLLGSS